MFGICGIDVLVVFVDFVVFVEWGYVVFVDCGICDSC